MTSKGGAARTDLAHALHDYITARSAIAVAEVDVGGAIVRANRALERLAARPLAGTPIGDLVAEQQRPALARLLAATGREWRTRTLGLFPNERGVPVDFAVSCRALGAHRLVIAEPAAATVAAVDEQLLTLNDELAAAQRRIRRQNAQLERQNDRLQQLDRLKDGLLASVSHDLRTPLTAILGYTELLRRRGGLAPKQARAVDVVERNAHRLLRLVDDLLLLAQARAGTLTVRREALELAHIAAEAVELARPLAAEAGLTVVLDAEPGGAPLDGDPVRIATLVDNLVGNAIKFTPRGGRITVRVRASGGSAALEVEDTGPGIEARERERLLEPFARGEQVEARGAGLGLAIVRTVAEAHGATLGVTSAPGRGARFSVEFPLRSAAERERRPIASA